MATIKADYDYLQGHLRYGHIELELEGEELEEFKSKSQEEQKEYLREMGETILDDYEVNDYGDLGEIKIVE